MPQVRRRLAALATLLGVALSLLVPGASAAPKPSPSPPGHYRLLRPPGTTAEDAEVDAAIREGMPGEPMVRELTEAAVRIGGKNSVISQDGNISVQWFDLKSLANAEDLPEWVRKKVPEIHDLLLDAGAESARSGAAERMIIEGVEYGEANKEVYRAIGATPDSRLVKITSGSTSRKTNPDGEHSELRAIQWLEKYLPNVLMEVSRSRTDGDPIRGSKARILARRIMDRTGLYFASPRGPCLDKCDRATRIFAGGFALVHYGRMGSRESKAAGAFVSLFMPKARIALGLWKRNPSRDAFVKAWDEKATAMSRQKNARQEEARRDNLGLGACPPTGASGYGGAGERRVLAMAARPLAASCAESGSSALAEGDYGGVDLSTLELRYLSDRPDAGDVRYAFSARAASPGGTSGDGPQAAAAATAATADLRTWLVLSPQTFWVNLNPTEPDRVIDPALGQTGAGRAMLEADLRMKRTQGKLLDPDTAFGARYWKAMARSEGKLCFSSRMWIVPGDVRVYEDDDSLYVLQAPLTVKMKAEDIGGSYSCGSTDPAASARNEELERSTVLPEIVKAVNTAPEYAPLRRAFTARVVAEWIRRRHEAGHRTSFDDLIDSGDLGGARRDDGWRPRQVFDDYVRSIRDREFTFRQTVRRGRTTLVRTLTFGGVDFGSVPTTTVDAAEMNRLHPDLPRVVRASASHPEKGRDGVIWLGERQTFPEPSLWTRAGDFLSGRTGVLVLVVAGLGVVLFGFRGRRPKR
ncbi:hypothetical protein [Streptosporangium saharense]|uniref:DUF2330 domain-containing protein n=1 Tax=Streptosporangium saharense TaxID=1706840 RepID=A0A7W7VPG8_9ACTN|nr:hypothetical protein [Streptosporangium saharense]MBB4917504.1 hypothetical protein [Streptosporangium saharense]